MKFCREKFTEEASQAEHANRLFEPSEDGETWNINGCCGGGCFVVIEMRYCPFCGAKLKEN